MSEYEKQDLEDRIFCAKCNSLVEETLLLTCDHNLCIECAARNLYNEERKNIHKYKTVVCEICYSQTSLDNNTANELLSLLPQKTKNYSISTPQTKKETPSNLKINSSSSTLTNHPTTNYMNDSLLNMSVISKSQANNINNHLNSKKEFCKDHGEELTYYCFDCLCRCICSECVVHGAHKNHEVMNVKRAYPLIIEKSEDLLLQVQNRIQEIANVQHSIEVKKKELVDSSNIIKDEMARVFEEIRIRLQKKEKEIYDKTEVFLQEHLQEMNTYSRVLQSKVISLNKTIDSIQSNISRRDEVTLLNFFSESKSRIMQTVETELPDIPDFETIYNMKVNINQTSFDNLVNNLNAIHLEITSIKGLEVSKIKNTQKFGIKRDLYGTKSINNTQMNTTTLGNNLNNSNLNNSRTNLNTYGGHNTQIGQYATHNNSYDFSRNPNMSFKSLNSQYGSPVEELSDRLKNILN